MKRPTNNEDKLAWCRHGEKLEREFIEKVAPSLFHSAIINPEKEENVFATDLIVNGVPTDLKTVRTPFLVCGKFSYNPNYTVTINEKDIERYRGKEMAVIFWVEWEAQSGYGVTVEAHSGVYGAKIHQLINALGPKHTYQNRSKDGSGNALTSHLVDLRRLWKYR